MNDSIFERNYALNPDSAMYRQGVFDVIRIFIPAFEWSQPQNADKEGNETTVVEIAVSCEDETWTLHIGTDTCSFAVKGLDENQRRRLLKQTLYTYFAEQSEEQHPWGIMTGIRPTKIAHRYREDGLDSEAVQQRLMEDYFMSEAKAALLVDVTQRQKKFLPTHQQAKDAVSIYLSIPFCPTRCSYCSFPSFCLPKPHLQEQYLDALIAECKAVGGALKERNKRIQTIYIGGGTPTSLSAVQLQRLLDGVAQHLSNEVDEFTVEAGRPDTITEEKLQLLRDYNVGRISINPQSFSQRTLDAIGRCHTVQDIIDVYHIARQIGFDSINMDLITGLTRESLEEFQHSLAQISRLQPENLTVHTLAIKRTAKLLRKDFNHIQADIVKAMHEELSQWLKGQAYVPYYLYRQKNMIGDQENTGYCLPGKESLYNILMMEERQTIFGLGVGSASKYINADDWTLTQSNNPKDLYFYNERIEALIAKKVAYIEHME